MSTETWVPFNRPYMTGGEIKYIAEAHANGHLSGDGPFTRKCQAWLEEHIGARKALLTHSCTAALEMSAILADIRPGDEVIIPSYTFVSTANAFALRGARLVFVDIRKDTLNIDEDKIESAITPRSRCICVVHYAGVPCEMDRILEIAHRHGLWVIEDAAQALGSSYRGRPAGSMGGFSCFSFHETKNIISGEGGAILINKEDQISAAEIIREKGTNRSRFLRGQVDKYTWVDIGSSYLPGEIVAAFLAAQCERADEITARRLAVWRRYHDWAERWEHEGLLRRPSIPDHCNHNAHMYYLMLRSLDERTAFIEHLRAGGIMAVFHYVPLHSSPAGLRFGTFSGSMENTVAAGDRLVRLPLWIGVEDHIDRIHRHADAFFRSLGPTRR